MVGAAEIRHIQLTKKQLQITFGKHDYATINIKTGEVTCVGAD